MPPVGRPRVKTLQGSRAPTQQLSSPDLMMTGSAYNPLSGAPRPWHMFIDPYEQVPELRWPLSVWTYENMRTDTQLAALWTAVMFGIQQLRFVVDPNGCPESMVKEISQDLNVPILGQDGQPRGRMKGRFTLGKHISQALLSVLYGHMYFEQVGTIVDGKFRLRKLAPMMPHTIAQINVADDGGLVSVRQFPSMGLMGGSMPGMGPELPVDRLTGYIFQQEGASWVGRSMFRDCYKPWLLKDRLMRVEAVNHERAGGIPYAEGAEGMNYAELQDLAEMMQHFRIGEMAGGAVPYGTKLQIAKGSGSDIDKTIRRHDESMARRFLLMLANLAQGGQHVGSYALGEVFEDFFVVGQRAITQWFCDVVTEHIIEDIIDWNYGDTAELTPILTWERTTEDSLGVDNLALLVQRGVITMDEELENVVRYKYRLPNKTEPRPEVTPGGAKQYAENQPQSGVTNVPGETAPGATPPKGAPSQAALAPDKAEERLLEILGPREGEEE